MLLPFSDHETQLHLTLLARQPWLQATARQIANCFGNKAGHGDIPTSMAVRRYTCSSMSMVTGMSEGAAGFLLHLLEA